MPGELGVYCEGRPVVYSVGLMQGEPAQSVRLLARADRRPGPFHGKTFIIVGGLGPKVREAFEEVEFPIWVQHEENGRAAGGLADLRVPEVQVFKEPPPEVPH